MNMPCAVAKPLVQGRALETRDLGRMPYRDALEMQEQRVAARKSGRCVDTLLFVEHDPVFTLGRNADEANIELSHDELEERGIEVVRTTRGGEVTYHGPGQLVVYPIIDLAGAAYKVTDYVAMLEKVVLGALSDFNIAATTDSANRGAWVGNDKIAALGVRITRGITMHGFAINVNVEPSDYDGIVACGIKDKGITSMHLLSPGVTIAAVKTSVQRHFAAVFGHTPLPIRKPDWLRVRVGAGSGFTRTNDIVSSGDLHTVCEEAMCPNRGDCWKNGKATVMILGKECTRSCTFCGVGTAGSGTCDPEEPLRVAEAVKQMGLSGVVITSVTRDDLDDGGASIWAQTIRAIRETVPGISVEVLIPDFQGNGTALKAVLDEKPDVLAHNLETVPSLYSSIRPRANYDRSLGLLSRAAEAGLITKTGIMVGLGEAADEVHAVMQDALEAGVKIFTIGQYLRPTLNHYPVIRYVEPAEFDEYTRIGQELGFGVVSSGPLVRSSLHSEEQSNYVANTRRNT